MQRIFMRSIPDLTGARIAGVSSKIEDDLRGAFFAPLFLQTKNGKNFDVSIVQERKCWYNEKS